MKTKNIRKIIGILVITLIVIMPASATKTVINFDDLDGDESLTDQYPGVVFTDAVIKTLFEYHSKWNIASSGPGSMKIVFDNPVSRVKLWYGNSQDAWLEAYDIDDNFLSDVIAPQNVGSFYVDSVEILHSSNDIKYVIYDSGAGMDDLEYETTESIPEFPTVALPVIAVIGLMFLFQRRKTS